MKDSCSRFHLMGLKAWFSLASAIEIYDNIKLCGGIPKLQLQQCPIQEVERPGKHTTLKLVLMIVIPISLIGLTFSLLSLFRTTKMKHKSLATSSFELFYPKISYEELLKETSGFSIENLIGSGNYGKVYKGMLSPNETIVVVKVLNLHQRGAAKSFMAECKVLRNARHRNLVKALTACSSTDYDGNEFKALVFEFMPNGTLESCNVLLDNDLTAHVSDFGLARLLSISRRDITSGQFSSIGVKGTTGYVAIEYGLGEEVSTRGDTYSFRILLFKMLTGRRPTNELFKDDLNLHNFAKMALPRRVTGIVDEFLSSEEMKGV
ncbi:unnamed protein product [Camellia sinensis]